MRYGLAYHGISAQARLLGDFHQREQFLHYTESLIVSYEQRIRDVEIGSFNRLYTFWAWALQLQLHTSG